MVGCLLSCTFFLFGVIHFNFIQYFFIAEFLVCRKQFNFVTTLGCVKAKVAIIVHHSRHDVMTKVEL